MAGNDPNVLSQINNGFVQLNDTSQSLNELSVKVDGPVFSIPGGDVLAAIGSSYRGQRAQQLQSAGCESCSFYQIVRDDNIHRGVYALFGEVNIPLVGAPNAMPGIQALTLSIAGRYDNYDGLESQFNPKVGFSWAPIDSLRIHGSTGDSYVAPNMGLITATFGVPQTGLRDNIGSTNYDFDIYNKGGGAPALEPEFAKSSTFGFSWQPAFAEGLSVGVTYYEVEYTNLVYKPRRSDVLDIPAFEQHRGFGPYDPVNDVFLPFSQEEVDRLIEFAPPQTPIVPVQTFNMWFDSYALNIGTRIQGGFDYNIRYNFDTSIGQWGLGLIANEQTRFDEEVVPGSGSFSRIGTRNAPGWQSRFQTQWSGNNIPLRISLISMHKSGYANGVDSIESHLFHNLTLAYDIEGWFNGVTLQARFRNLTDEEPPFFDSGTGYDDDNHTPYGRQMDLTLRASL